MTHKQFLEAHHVVVDPEGKSHELFEQALAAHRLTRRVVLGSRTSSRFRWSSPSPI